uniref:Mu opioid receptor isoform MOR-1K n=1 Tax=Mus musculus TaxID=10090 RepID=Q4U2P0_MOUSE|nr:mu opioid receptor isoform MOR-1K [Mus musculus]AAL34403.1 mu opioid receptor isoform MOR-1L [Mus musculus]
MMEAFSKSAFQKLRQRDGNQEGKSYLRLPLSILFLNKES